MITSGVRACAARKSARVCVKIGVLCTHTPVAIVGSCHCLDAKLSERTQNLRSVQDFEWRLDSGEFDNG